MDNAPNVESPSEPSWRPGCIVLLVALVPVLTAVWGVRWFVTQDGSAHLYNSHIIAQSLRPNSPFAAFYEVHWEPLPNWSGHIITAILVSVLPDWAAGAAVTSLTLVAFAVSIVWLRLRVAGSRGLGLTSLLAVLLALNFPWLLGFTSFMLGAPLRSHWESGGTVANGLGGVARRSLRS